MNRSLLAPTWGSKLICAMQGAYPLLVFTGTLLSAAAYSNKAIPPPRESSAEKSFAVSRDCPVDSQDPQQLN